MTDSRTDELDYVDEFDEFEGVDEFDEFDEFGGDVFEDIDEDEAEKLLLAAEEPFGQDEVPSRQDEGPSREDEETFKGMLNTFDRCCEQKGKINEGLVREIWAFLQRDDTYWRIFLNSPVESKRDLPRTKHGRQLTMCERRDKSTSALLAYSTSRIPIAIQTVAYVKIAIYHPDLYGSPFFGRNFNDKGKPRSGTLQKHLARCTALVSSVYKKFGVDLVKTKGRHIVQEFAKKGYCPPSTEQNCAPFFVMARKVKWMCDCHAAAAEARRQRYMVDAMKEIVEELGYEYVPGMEDDKDFLEKAEQYHYKTSSGREPLNEKGLNKLSRLRADLMQTLSDFSIGRGLDV
jgi:hypothetical protein